MDKAGTMSTLCFTGPRTIEVQSGPIPQPGPGQILVETERSAISAGTEMLVYQDRFPSGMALDGSFDSGQYSRPFAYPLSYGYVSVGRVLTVGDGLSVEAYKGRPLFAFQPHTSHFLTTPDQVIWLSERFESDLESPLFIPNMETAVNLVQDGRPLLGERVLIIGLGIVGLLTGALLAQFPLQLLAGIDYYERRCAAANGLGVDRVVTPDGAAALEAPFDLIFELSGNPAALNTAIELASYSGRIVVGSWYGQKSAPLALGGRFHRNRIEMISSQVSSIDPKISGRWDKDRRFETVFDQIAKVEPSEWITHRFPIEEAAKAYQLLDQMPEEALQVVFTYG